MKHGQQLPITFKRKNPAHNLFIALVFLSLSIPGIAQTRGIIHGYVKDEKTGEALPGANISLVGKQIGQSAKSNGEFQLSVPAGKQQIQVSFLGYKTVRKELTITVGENTSIDFLLQSDIVGANEVIVLGSRGSVRTVINSSVPVDVISAKDIEHSGYTQTSDLLKTLIPSFNAPQASLTDGSDHVRPASLRSLGPDQVLVLVNGKRRYTSALVNVNGTIGRGSTGVDYNAIPASAIDHIEVLRDGASAQYGSDAIAGVINIILKDRKGLDASASYGEYVTTQNRGYSETEGNIPGETAATYSWDGNPKDVKITDGFSKAVHLGYGLSFLADGSLYISGEYRKHNPTNRAGLDPRQQYITVNGQADPREASFNRLNHRFGDADLEDVGLFLNSSIPVNDESKLYLFGGYSSRDGSAAGFYRRSLDDRNVRAIYPDGFLPLIDSKIKDGSLAAGLKGVLGTWTYDLSESYGGNSFDFNVDHSLNTSYGTNSPTSFYAGSLKFLQSTTNLDLVKQLSVGTADYLNIALGAEFRWEKYELDPGSPNSYTDGGVTILDGPNAGKPASIGAQVFPGFLPVNAQNQTRTNVGVYADLENRITQLWTVGAAGRFEDYNDFGSTLNGKLDTRYEITPELAVRGALSNGFRAPSLAQEYFSSISTTFISGVPYEVGTFPVNSLVAKALGAKDLKAEKSVNISAGITYALANLSLTVDGYQIRIKDRIVLTENFTGSSIANFLQTKGINATGGRFFTNGINTKTNGIDLTARYGFTLAGGSLRLIAALNFNKTEITNKDQIVTPAELKAITTTPILGRVEQGRIESGQPKSSINLQGNYSYTSWSFLLRAIRYGEITSYNTNPAQDQTFRSLWTIDAEASYEFIKGLSFAFGGNNLFDIYPDKVLKINSTSGLLPYSSSSPSGYNGRYIYSRVSISI
jgi:iron complex outermembrane receptor protein